MKVIQDEHHSGTGWAHFGWKRRPSRLQKGPKKGHKTISRKDLGEEINGTKETLTDVLLAMVMMVLDTWLCCFGTTMFLFALGLGILVVSNFLFYDFMLSLLLLKETSGL